MAPGSSLRRSTPTFLAALAISVFAAAGGVAAEGGAAGADRPASASAGYYTGIMDPAFADYTDPSRELSLDRSASVGAKYVLSVASWASLAPRDPATSFNPADPNDPGYDWTTLDDFVVEATARGLTPIVSVANAPTWAEGDGRPATAPAGTWKPQPNALGDFAAAIAVRYSGTFDDPDTVEQGILPRVELFQAWTEPNLDSHLTPQWGAGGKPQSPALYTKMLNAFYEGIKRVQPDAAVITAGASPYGDVRGSGRVRPLKFWRSVLCIKESGRHLRKSRCPTEAKFDVFAHNAINTAGPPRRPAMNPDDISTADLGSLVRVLRFAERKGTTASPGTHPMWITEFWWESDPPDPRQGVPLRRQARYIQEAMYLFWKADARVVINFRAVDFVQNEETAKHQSATGLFFETGEPKPAAQAFRFPFIVGDGSGRVRLWGRAPTSGTAIVERKTARGWQTVRRVNTGADGVFTARIELNGDSRVRARLGAASSLVWKQR